MKLLLNFFVLIIVCSAGSPGFVRAQSKQEITVRQATEVLRESLDVRLPQIPTSMLDDAQGVAIIPNVIKGSFVLGARHGRGVLMVRDEHQLWHAPVFVTLTGGNIGWQIGVQATDVVLVFKTQRSVEGILSGKFTIGADASAAAGPIGRKASASTDGQLRAEIYSYSRSRGLFAGVSLDGSVIQVDRVATGQYYQTTGPQAPVIVPDAATELTQMVAHYAGATVPAEAFPNAEMPLAQQIGQTDVDALRDQLAVVSPQLYAILDDSWRAYLGMPHGVFTGQTDPPIETVQEVLARFESAAKDARYQTLAARPEFQSTFGLLRQYMQARTASAGQLQLPPPPQD